ncbi:MAG: FMN-binding protein [Bacteroidia bacterium]|nr:FMN-binding protein [Bacteroidia bacterium]
MLSQCFGFTQNADLFSKKAHKTILSTYDIKQYEVSLVSIDSEISEILPANFSNDNFYKIQSEDILIGYAYFGTTMSMVDTFDYLILFDKELIIKNTKVIKYREDYGSEIGSKRWLKQFTGKTSEDKVIYGENIAAISGATISVKAMTKAMNNVLKSLKILINKQVL